jgi:hypothetical protein
VSEKSAARAAVPAFEALARDRTVVLDPPGTGSLKTKGGTFRCGVVKCMLRA